MRPNSVTLGVIKETASRDGNKFREALTRIHGHAQRAPRHGAMFACYGTFAHPRKIRCWQIRIANEGVVVCRTSLVMRRPIFQHQARHARKLARIVGDADAITSDCLRCNQRIIEADLLARFE